MIVAQQPAGRDREPSGGPTIEYLSPVTEAPFPLEFYEIGEERHFWMEWRFAVALRLFKASGLAVDRALRALDIGGGAGRFRDQIERDTLWRVDLTDINLPALRMARPARGRTLYYDLTQADPALLGVYDIAFLFDVIEHVESPGPLLRAAVEHLRPGGHLLLNVPALQTLYSAYDVVQGHVRRYSRSALAADLASLPCQVEDIFYWGFGLVPFLGLRRLLVGRTPRPSTYRAGFQPSPIANHALKALMRAELAVLKRPPLGTSVMAVARKLGE
jgi:SAM-dependent methyltransferase